MRMEEDEHAVVWAVLSELLHGLSRKLYDGSCGNNVRWHKSSSLTSDKIVSNDRVSSLRTDEQFAGLFSSILESSGD
jgi:hypothetical protein